MPNPIQKEQNQGDKLIFAHSSWTEVGQDFAAFNTLFSSSSPQPAACHNEYKCIPVRVIFSHDTLRSFKVSSPTSLSHSKSSLCRRVRGSTAIFGARREARRGQKKKCCWWYSVGRLSLKQGWLSWHFGRMWRGLWACLLFNFLFFFKRRSKNFWWHLCISSWVWL